MRWWMLVAVMAYGCAAEEPGAETAGELRSSYCNPVTQMGCDPGQKCTAIVSSPHSVCVEDGAVLEGGACSLDEAAGYDDCTAGLICHPWSTEQSGGCVRICHVTPDNCPEGLQCMLPRASFFGGITSATLGVCLPEVRGVPYQPACGGGGC